MAPTREKPASRRDRATRRAERSRPVARLALYLARCALGSASGPVDVAVGLAVGRDPAVPLHRPRPRVVGGQGLAQVAAVLRDTSKRR